MSVSYIDNGAGWVPEARLGVPGFEKFLVVLLALFSLLWIFYLRHFASPYEGRQNEKVLSIEIRSQPQPVVAPGKEVNPEPSGAPAAIVESPPRPAVQNRPAIENPPVARENEPLPEAPERSQASLVEQVLRLHAQEHPEWKELPDPDANDFRPDDVFDPRLADRIAKLRQEKHALTQLRGNNRGDASFIDDDGVLNYRRGNTCYKIVEIPGVDYQWYGGKCATKRNEMEFEFNGEHY